VDWHLTLSQRRRRSRLCNQAARFNFKAFAEGALEIWILGNQRVTALLADEPYRPLQHRSESIAQKGSKDSERSSHPSYVTLSSETRAGGALVTVLQKTQRSPDCGLFIFFLHPRKLWDASPDVLPLGICLNTPWSFGI
jgi:hypothetical protein